MSQIGSHRPASRNGYREVRFHRQVVLRLVGYAGGSYLLALAVVWIGETRTDGETYLYLAVPALALTSLATITARRRVRLGRWSDRRMRSYGVRRIRYRPPAAGDLSGAGRRLISEDASLPFWINAEPRLWPFAPLVLLALWTLVAVFRAS